MTEESLPDWRALGFSPTEAETLAEWGRLGIDLYNKAYARLDALAIQNPAVVRIPEVLAKKPLAVARLTKNYALDRARYFLPFALTTNIALVQSARNWTETLTGLYSLGIPEATRVADAIKAELATYAPNLIRHARPKSGWTFHQRNDPEAPLHPAGSLGLPKVRVDVLPAASDEVIARALTERENRYDRCGIAARDTAIRVTWNRCMAIAELRDLNRHRTGSRFSPLTPTGFYLPQETKDLMTQAELTSWADLTDEIAAFGNDSALRPYTLSLGSKTSYTHTTTLDKFVYLAELRTGAGAHFKYAQDVLAAVEALAAEFPRTAAAIKTGQYLPE